MKKIKIELADFRKNGKERIYEDIFGNYQMNYLTEFDMDKDILIIVLMFLSKKKKIKGWCGEKVKSWEVQGDIKKQIIIIIIKVPCS